MQVGSGDNDVGIREKHLTFRTAVLDSRSHAVLDNDALDIGTGHDGCPLTTGEFGDRIDHGAEAAHGIEHAVGEIKVAHQVVHTRGFER